MKTTKLGELIEITTKQNTDLKYGLDDCKGMTITKEIIPTKANLEGNDLSKFRIVEPNEFVYNPRTHGKKIGLGYNNTKSSFIISWNNVSFKVKDINVLIPDYLYLIFTREEWDRNACFRSWGSSTEVFSWDELCLMEIPLPDLETQKQIVASYNGLKNIIDDNMALVEPLEKLCHAYIVDLKKKYTSVTLGDYIHECDERNTENKLTVENLRGVTSESIFDISKANTEGIDFSKYKIVKSKQFGYNPSRINLGSIALLNEPDVIVSPMYCVFKIAKTDKVLPEYLSIWFNRKEFQRSTLYYASGSVRDTFDFGSMCEVKLPIPPIEVQQSIVNIYNCAQEAKKIANEAKEELKKLCPALVQFASKSA